MTSLEKMIEGAKNLILSHSDIEDLVAAVATSTYNQTIDICEGVVPDEQENNFSTAYDDWTPERAAEEEGLVQGHNSCRPETLKNLAALKQKQEKQEN